LFEKRRKKKSREKEKGIKKGKITNPLELYERIWAAWNKDDRH